MNWIKKRYDQFLLVLAALALLGVAGLIALRAQNFGENFNDARANVVPGEKIVELDLAALKQAQAEVAAPAKWVPGKENNPYVFVPARYIMDPTTGQPTKPDKSDLHSDSLTGKKIPSPFFSDNSLPLLDPGVAKQDPDKDGFTNEDEWRGARDAMDPMVWSGISEQPKPDAHTNPNKADSHPPLISKIFLKKWIRVPFLLLFKAVDGEPGKTKPEELSFQINATDQNRRSKTEFLKLGEKVANSPYRLEKFEFKEIPNPKTGAQEDVSELTVVNTETTDSVVLVKGRQTDSPDSYGLFENQLTGKEIGVKKLLTFELPPEKERYKLVDIKEGQALIDLPNGGTYVVVPDPRKR